MNDYNLVPFNRNFLISKFGMYNNSTMCYFNSMIQSVLSCPSVVEYILRVMNTSGVNLIINLLGRIIENGEKISIEYNLELFNEFLRQLKKKYPKLNFGFTQEDAGEMFVILLDLLNDNYLNCMFQHTYKCNIFCMDCRKSKDLADDVSYYFTVDINEIKNFSLSSKMDSNSTNELNKFIRNNYSKLEGIKCSLCKGKDVIKTNRLITAPTIIMIIFNKYKEKIEYVYPSTLSFSNRLSDVKTSHHYRVVSSVHHNGNTNFGHYYAKCLRKSGVFNLNDTSFISGDLSPEANSYIVLYHYTDTVEDF